jgi:hypothetical protein
MVETGDHIGLSEVKTYQSLMSFKKGPVPVNIPKFLKNLPTSDDVPAWKDAVSQDLTTKSGADFSEFLIFDRTRYPRHRQWPLKPGIPDGCG